MQTLKSQYYTVDWLDNMAFLPFVVEISQDTSHSFVVPAFFAECVKIAVADGRRELFQKYKLNPRNPGEENDQQF